MAEAAGGLDVLLEGRARGQRPAHPVDDLGRGMPLGPVAGVAGVVQHRLGRAAQVHHVLLADQAGLGHRLPVQGAVEPVGQREHDVHVALLHQVAAVVQGVQVAHVADPGQARDGVAVGQVLAGVQHLVEQVAQHPAGADHGRELRVERPDHRPERHGAGALYHHQPGREQDHPPVPRLLEGHVALLEEAVVVAGVALVEHRAQAPLVVPQPLVDAMLAPVEEQQGQGQRQPLPRPDVLRGRQQGGRHAEAEQGDEAGVQPGVVAGADRRPVAFAECMHVETHAIALPGSSFQTCLSTSAKT